MAARMGAITGKGLSDLIREEFGLRATFFTMVVLGVADFGNIIAEFAGLASGMGIFGVSKYIVVPIGAAIVWTLVVRGSYRPVERILIIASLVYFAYPISAFLAKPDWHEAIEQTFAPTITYSPAYLVVVVGLIGTTITPWMQFYLQAAVVEKGVDARHYGLCRARCHYWLHRHRRNRILYRGSLRRDHSSLQAPGNHRRRASSSRSQTLCRQVCIHSLRLWAWSMRPCSLPLSFHSRPLTTFAKASDLNQASTSASPKRLSFIGCTLC